MKSHEALVDVAVRWLRKTVRCGVVLREHRSLEAEFPDAIGWKSGWSYMVECKASRSDFLADQKKLGRKEGRRLAWRCYYLTVPGLIRPDELPANWGLLEAAGNGRARIVCQVPEPVSLYDDRQNGELRHELRLLYSELRRYQAQGIKYRRLKLGGGYADDGALGSLTSVAAALSEPAGETP